MIIVLPEVFTTDIITNSSSELFVTDRTRLDAVRDVLLDIYNDFVAENPDELTSLEKMLTVDILTEEDAGFIAMYSDYQHIEWGDPDYDDKWEQWYDKYIPKVMEMYQGRVVIRSVSDNTIPYKMIERIEDTINCKRWHLG